MFIESLSGVNRFRWPNDWVRLFLNTRGIKEPDSRPLYAYRCSSQELDEAGEVFRAVESDLRSFGELDSAGPLFCLFAAEWWHRNHKDGPWKWAGILEATGLADVNWQLEIYPLVERGLRYWRRPLLRGSFNDRRFLLTLGCEGGLPLQLIRNGSGSLARYFRALLEEYSIFRRSGVPTTRLAERVDKHLPPSLRRDVVYQLGAELIEGVWKLKEAVGAAKNPIAFLDERDPAWRTLLPLSVEDGVASSLLSGLVIEAVEIEGRLRARTRMTRQLIRSEDKWTLIAETSCPASLTHEELARALGVPLADVPAFGRLVMQSDSGRRAMIASAFASGDAGARTFRLMSTGDGRLEGSAAREGWRLRLESDLRSVGQNKLAGGESLEDLPWVFAVEDESSARFVGQGSVSTRYGPLLVAVPAAAVFDGGVECGITLDDWRVVRVDGAMQVSIGDAAFRVAASQLHDRSMSYRLTGQTLSLSSNEVFRGLPRLSMSTDEALGSWKPVPREQIELRVKRLGEWATPTLDSFGQYRVRVRRPSGETVYQRVVEVVPSDIEIRLAPANRLGIGSFEIHSSQRLHAAVADPLDVTSKCEGIEGGISLRCESSSRFPLEVTIRLNFASGGTVDLRVPYPSRAVRVTSTDGRIAKHDDVIGFDQLSRWRVLASLPDVDAPLTLEGTLHAKESALPLNVHLSAEVPMRRGTLGQHSLELLELEPHAKRLFALCDDHMASIRTKVDVAGVFPLAVEIRRFEAEFEMRDGIAQVRGDELSPGDVEVKALRLWDPSAHEVNLAPLVTGWSLGACDPEPGPWIIYGTRGERCVYRPALRFVPGGGEEGFSPLANAIRVRDRATCEAAIRSVFADMARAPLQYAADWELVSETIRRLQVIPPSAFLVLIQLAKDPVAAVTALIQEADPGSRGLLLDGLEELPFLWSSVPLGAWRTQASRWADGLRTLISDEASANGVIRSQLDSLIEAIEWSPSHKLLALPAKFARAVAAPQTLEDAIEALQSFCREDLEPHRQSLIARHEGRQWPGFRVVQQEAGHRPGLGSVFLRHKSFSRHYQDSLDAPLVAARCAVQGRPVSLELLLELRRSREFDSEWFDYAYQWSYANLVMKQMRSGGLE